MTFSVTSTISHIRIQDPTEIKSLEKTIQVSLTPNQLALMGLILAQGSGLIISCLLPERASLIQAGTLTLALCLFLRCNTRKTIKHITIENDISCDKRPQIDNQLFEIKPALTPKKAIDAQYFTGRALGIDEKIDHILNELGQSLYRTACWKLIPHPNLFKK
jgi:hypothetical protein